MIREAGPGDIRALQNALEALSRDLGDDHRAGEDALGAACFGPRAFALALLAETKGTVAGATLATPVFSTSKGAPGTYVSDLWVAPSCRGGGLGRRLLAHAAQRGAKRWGARFVKLAVYDDNPRARAFYEQLGFAFRDHERNAILEGEDLHTLIEDTR